MENKLFDALVNQLKNNSCNKAFSTCVKGTCPYEFDSELCNDRKAVMLVENIANKKWNEL